MALKFTPNGYLDLSTDPSELTGEAQGDKGEISGAMRRCTNLTLDQNGRASTRYGSSLVNSSAMSYTVPYKIIEQNGFRYCFNDTVIYKDESSIETGLTSAPWSAIKYNPYNSLLRSIYALNGKNRKRIEGENVFEWGIGAPSEEATIGLKSRIDSGASRYIQYLEIAEILYPVAAGDETNLDVIGAAANYDAVNDEDSNTSKFVHGIGRDLYSIANSTRTEVISKIRICMRCFSGSGTATAKTGLKIDGTAYNGTEYSVTSTPVNIYQEYLTHPGTSNTWTWDNVNDLQAGVTLGAWGRCIKLWVEVYYQSDQYEVVTSDDLDETTPAGLSGDFNYKYTYARKEGDTVICESNPSDAIDTEKDYAYCHWWEKDEGHTSNSAYNFTTDTYNDKECTFIWEVYNNDETDGYDTGTFYWEENHADKCTTPQTISGGMLRVMCSGPIDKQVTHVRLYRTTTGGVTYYHDKDIPLALYADYSFTHDWEESNAHVSGDGYNFTENYDTNSDHLDDTEGMYDWEKLVDATTYPFARNTHQWEPGIGYSDTADLSLGTAVSTNHNRPPSGTFVVGPTHEGICFIGNGKDLYNCLAKRPDYWPTDYFVEVSTKQFPLQNGCMLDGEVYVASTEEIYRIYGSGEGTYAPAAMTAITGTRGKNSLLGIHGYGIFHLGIDGIYLYTDKDAILTEEKFKPIFSGETVENIPGLNQTYIDNCWMVFFKNKLYFGYPSSSATYPDNLFVVNMATGKTVHFEYGQEFVSVCIDFENKRLLAADTSGYIWELEDSDATDDNGTDITWYIQSKDFTDQLYKYFPRYARWDVNLGSGATATGSVLLDGSVKQTHTLSTSRQTKKRLVTGCNGDRLSLRIHGTGSVDIYAAEAG